MKKTGIITLAIACGFFIASTTLAERRWETRQAPRKPGTLSLSTTSLGQEPGRTVTGKIGRGKGYTGKLNPTPLEFFWGEAKRPFDVQY